MTLKFLVFPLTLAAALSTTGIFASSRAVCGVTVTAAIKERLELRISTRSASYRAGGRTRADLQMVFRIEDNPVRIEACLRIGRRQMAELHVRREISNDQGEPHIAPDIAWEAIGAGFQSGRLTRNDPQVMARWIGPDRYRGTALFSCADDTRPAKESFAYVIAYSLVIL